MQRLSKDKQKAQNKGVYWINRQMNRKHKTKGEIIRRHELSFHADNPRIETPFSIQITQKKTVTKSAAALPTCAPAQSVLPAHQLLEGLNRRSDMQNAGKKDYSDSQKIPKGTKTIDLMIAKAIFSICPKLSQQIKVVLGHIQIIDSNLQTFIRFPFHFTSNPTIAHQNCYADLDYTKYPPTLHVLIEFLKSSVLNKALTAHAVISRKALTKAYSSAKYNSTKNIVEFDLESGKRTAITKTAFTKLLNLSIDQALIDPDKVSSADMIHAFNQMGHTPILTRLSAFKKNRLPSIWSCLFTILFKCLAQRQTETDSASKQFLTLMYALFTDSPIDLKKILWTQFCESPSSATKDIEISMGRFWSLVVDYAHRHYKIASTEPLPEDDVAIFPDLQIGKLTIKSDNFCEFVGKIPEEMLLKIDSENELRKAYQLANPLPYLLRDTPENIKLLIEKQKVVSRTQGKRKTTPVDEPSSPVQKKKQKKSHSKKAKKTLLQDEDSETVSDPNLQTHQGTQSPPRNSPISEPLSTAPLTTSIPISTPITEPIATSPLKTPPTTIPITTSLSTPDYSD
ncbi:hypothetical protein LXL04_015895 [Taraxacum kok-saghyz]